MKFEKHIIKVMAVVLAGGVIAFSNSAQAMKGHEDGFVEPQEVEECFFDDSSSAVWFIESGTRQRGWGSYLYPYCYPIVSINTDKKPYIPESWGSEILMKSKELIQAGIPFRGGFDRAVAMKYQEFAKLFAVVVMNRYCGGGKIVTTGLSDGLKNKMINRECRETFSRAIAKNMPVIQYSACLRLWDDVTELCQVDLSGGFETGNVSRLVTTLWADMTSAFLQ